MAALWVVICVAALVGLVFYLVRRRPHVLPDSRSRDNFPYMIETPPAHPGSVAVVPQTLPDDSDGDDGDDGGDADGK